MKAKEQEVSQVIYMAAESFLTATTSEKASGGNRAGGITAFSSHISFAEYGKDGDSAEVKNCYHAGGTVKGSSGAIAAECSYYEGIAIQPLFAIVMHLLDCGANGGAKGATGLIQAYF